MQLPATKFWFLRHGETDYNVRGLSQGALDISLNANGRAQAALAGPLLANRGIIGIISSPMIRTRETTEIINQSLNLPVNYEADLREVIFGGMEGKPLSPWFTSWMDGTYTPEGAESFTALTARVEAVFSRLLTSPGPVLLVSHGGVFRALRGIMNLSLEGLTPNAQPLFCQPTLHGWQVNAPDIPATLDAAAHHD